MKQKKKTTKQINWDEVDDDDVQELDGKLIYINPDKKSEGGKHEPERRTSITSSHTPTELGDVQRELDRDVLAPDTKMTSVDSKSFITEEDRDNLTAFNSLITLGMVSPKCLNISRQFLRASKSIEGMNLKIHRDIATGQREHEVQKLGTMAKIKKNLFNKKGQDQVQE